jgi:hypothetical protein
MVVQPAIHAHRYETDDINTLADGYGRSKNKEIPGLVGGAAAGKPGASCPQQSQLAHAPTLQDAVKQVVRERVKPRVPADGNRGREAQGGIHGR